MADDGVLQELQAQLNQAKCVTDNMSTLARQGSEKLLQEFLMDDVKIQSTGPFAKQSQLYVASFWGIKESVRKLLENGTNPNLQNQETLWTPLHAASFLEHGPVVMLLLEYGAQPELPDAENRTAADFASVSDKIWPFFAALDIQRTSRAELIEKNILRPGSGMKQTREPGHGITMAEYNEPRRRGSGDSTSNNYMAAMSGDVLADTEEPLNMGDSRYPPQPTLSMWK